MKYPAAFIMAAVLFCACSGKEQPPAPPAQPPAVSSAAAREYQEITVATSPSVETPECGMKKDFTGPKGESAAEYLLGMRLRQEDNALWAGDKRVCRYHSYIAGKMREAQEASLACGRASENFFGKTASGNIDLDKLSDMLSLCAKETAIYKTMSGKLKKGAPSAYFRSNGAIRSGAEAAYEAASARDEKMKTLVADWRDKTASGETASFPVEAARSIMKGTITQPGKTADWNRLFLEDSERYFDRSIQHGG